MRLIDAEAFEEALKTYKVDSISTLATCLKLLRKFPAVNVSDNKSEEAKPAKNTQQEMEDFWRDK